MAERSSLKSVCVCVYTHVCEKGKWNFFVGSCYRGEFELNS